MDSSTAFAIFRSDGIIAATKLVHHLSFCKYKIATATLTHFALDIRLIWCTYSLVANNLIPSIMNFKIYCKNSRHWNPVLLAIYEWTPNSKIWNPIRWIIWKLEQFRTPENYDDQLDECWF